MRKITKFLVTSFLLLTSAIGITTVGNNETKEVEAAGTEEWSVIGTVNGSSWDTDYDLTYNSSKSRYEINMTLNEGEKFKLRLNHSWDNSFGYCNNTGSGIGTYLTADGSHYHNEGSCTYANFKVKTTGKYLLWVKDGTSSYGCKSYGFGIELATDNYYTVTYYNGNDTISTDAEIAENTAYVPYFVEVDGYTFEGWYTDAGLTNEFVSGTTITDNLSLYGKYVEASDYTVYFEDNGTFGSTVHAYFFDGDRNNSWPGEQISKNENGKWEVTIDVSKGWENIIFGNGQNEKIDGVANPNWAQTNTLSLEGAAEGYTYVLGDKITEGDDAGRYSATLVAAPLTAPALTIYATPIENSGIRFVTGFPADMASEIRNNNVGFKFVFSGDSVDTKTGFYVCESTLESATIITNGESQEQIAADNGFAFYFGVRIDNIPEGYTKVEVTPAYQHLNYDTVYCPTVTYTITNSNGVITLA